MTPAPAPPKTCGSCTLCCKVFKIDTLDKPAGVWCSHCVKGRGCGIHGAHPQECRDFVCQWLKWEQMPETYRPDRCKVVITVEPPGDQLFASCDPASPMAWRSEPIYGFLKRYAQGALGLNPDLRVFARGGGRLWLITASEDVDLGLVDATVNYTLVRGADGKLKATVEPMRPAPDPAPG